MPRRFLTLCVALAGLLSAAPELAAQSMRPLRPADYYHLVEVSEPALTPDGSRVAYVRTTPIESEHRRPRYVGRPATASTATGQMSRHLAERDRFLDEALSLG